MNSYVNKPLQFLRRYFKTQKTLFTFFGASFGGTFPIGAIIIDIFFHPEYKIFQIYQHNPLHYLISTAPLVLGFMAGLIGIRDDRIQKQTRELAEINRILMERTEEMEDIMENIVQGILTINRDYTINKEYSTFIERIFDKKDLAGRDFISLLYSPKQEKERKELIEYLNILFENTTAGDAILQDLNPIKNIEIATSETEGEVNLTYLHFDFVRIMVAGELTKVMVIIQDLTEEISIEKKRAQERKEHSEELEKISAIIKLPSEDLEQFIQECAQVNTELEELFSNLEKLEEAQEMEKTYSLFSRLHSLKGESRLYGFRTLAAKIQTLENLSRSFMVKQNTDSDEVNEKSNLDKSMEIMLAISDIKIALNALNETKNRLIEKIQETQIGDSTFINPHMKQMLPDLSNLQGQINKLLQMIQKNDSRNVEVKRSDKPYWLLDLEKLLQDSVLELEQEKISRKLHPLFYEIELGNDEIQQLSPFKSSIIHLLQNSLSHGIESPEERNKNGKEELGNIILHMRKDDKHYIIAVEDDGRGIQLDVLKPKLLERGLIRSEQKDSITLKDVIRIIFQAGFSSSENSSQLAGQGIGTDAVRRMVKKFNGKISVHNRPGKGLTVTLLIPHSSVK